MAGKLEQRHLITPGMNKERNNSMKTLGGFSGVDGGSSKNVQRRGTINFVKSLLLQRQRARSSINALGGADGDGNGVGNGYDAEEGFATSANREMANRDLEMGRLGLRNLRG